MEYRDILRKWFPNAEPEIWKLNRGISSGACFVRAEKQRYILRHLSGEGQAKTEARVLGVLGRAGISPALVPTLSGDFYTRAEGHFFNLQEFMDGEPPKLCTPEMINAAAASVAQMHRIFAETGIQADGRDRFDALLMLEKAKTFIGMLKPFFPEAGDGYCDLKSRILAMEDALRQDQTIHGDLGAWNMLWDGERIRLLDFGECRMSDPCMDIAAVLGSIVAESRETEDARNVQTFLNKYEAVCGSVSGNRLYAACFLWQFRGALAATVYLPDIEQKQDQINRFYRNYVRIKRVL